MNITEFETFNKLSSFFPDEKYYKLYITNNFIEYYSWYGDDIYYAFVLNTIGKNLYKSSDNSITFISNVDLKVPNNIIKHLKQFNKNIMFCYNKNKESLILNEESNNLICKYPSNRNENEINKYNKSITAKTENFMRIIRTISNYFNTIQNLKISYDDIKEGCILKYNKDNLSLIISGKYEIIAEKKLKYNFIDKIETTITPLQTDITFEITPLIINFIFNDIKAQIVYITFINSEGLLILYTKINNAKIFYYEKIHKYKY